MKKLLIFAALIAALAADSSPVSDLAIAKLSPWMREKKLRSFQTSELAEGVTFLSAHFDNLFGDGPVATYWLFIDWNKAEGISLNIAHDRERRQRPSDLAKANGAIACVNGTYHKMSDPSLPYCQLKVDGVLLPSQYDGGDFTMAFNKGEMPYIGKFKKSLLEDYAFVISGDGIPGRGWKAEPYADTSLAARTKRIRGRCPCTFAGNIASNRVTVIGIADGRQLRSIGLDYKERRYLLESFGCDPDQLVSFDGGGSTMMGVRTRTGFKVMSVPSDGYPVLSLERRVCESLQILSVSR